jgi:uncharacterized GH25 family protein
MYLRLTFALTVAFLARPVFGHDFWIEPSTFRPALGTPVQVYLRVGEHFAGDPVPRNPSLIERFAVVNHGEEVALPGRYGMDPAGEMTPASAGPHWLVYESRASFVELQPEAFHAYLREEGLEAIVGRREQLGESGKNAKEAFFRGAKSLVCAGDELAAGAPAAAGLAVEIVAESDLCAARAGGWLSFRVVFRGEPVANALVVGLLREDPDARLTARSDAAGRVELRLERPGAWLVKAVHMVRAEAGASVDWESYWASLTFELPAP